MLKAVCTRVNAEAMNGDPARNIEPTVYSMSSDRAGKLLAAIEKRCPTEVIGRPSFLAVDGQVAQITTGPLVQTMTACRNDQGETTFEPGVEHAGLSVSLTPTIEGNRQTRIALAIKNSKPTNSVRVIGTEANGKTVTTPIIASEEMKTTLKAADGRTVLVAVHPMKVTVDGKKPEPTRTTLVLLTPRVVERTADAGEILHH